MRPAVTDKKFRDGFHLEIIRGVKFKNSKAYAGSLKRLKLLGLTDAEAKEILGEPNV